LPTTKQVPEAVPKYGWHTIHSAGIQSVSWTRAFPQNRGTGPESPGRGRNNNDNNRATA